MAKAERVHSTQRRAASKIQRPRRKTKAKKFESAIAKVRMSGLELVKKRPGRGKRATLRDYATIDFEPLAPATELFPAGEYWNRLGTNCHMAHAICLKTRDELIAIHGKNEHETVDLMMAGILETAEALKQTVVMCEAAYGR